MKRKPQPRIHHVPASSNDTSFFKVHRVIFNNSLKTAFPTSPVGSGREVVKTRPLPLCKPQIQHVVPSILPMSSWASRRAHGASRHFRAHPALGPIRGGNPPTAPAIIRRGGSRTALSPPPVVPDQPIRAFRHTSPTSTEIHQRPKPQPRIHHVPASSNDTASFFKVHRVIFKNSLKTALLRSFSVIPSLPSMSHMFLNLLRVFRQTNAGVGGWLLEFPRACA